MNFLATLNRRSVLVGMALAPMAALLAPTASADKITLNNGHSLEGLIRGEDAYYVRIDQRGVIIPVPRERIQAIITNTPEENARTLLNQAQEAVTRNEPVTARNLIEQAKNLQINDAGYVESLNKLDQQLQEIERAGGTPEERRSRAQVHLRRATEAYDRIRNDEGNEALLEALKTDPTYDEANARIDQMLTGTNIDLMMAAEYFAEVMWPNHVRADSPVIGLLPQAYHELVERLNQTSDMLRAAQYFHWLQTIGQAFETNPAWKQSSDEDIQALLDIPLDSVMMQLVEDNLNARHYDYALQKLDLWNPPRTSADVVRLYARAMTGMGQLGNATALLETTINQQPEANALRADYNALKLLQQAISQRDGGNVSAARADLEKIFAQRQALLPEIGDVTGQFLALIKGDELGNPPPGTPAYGVASTAALVLRYGRDPGLRQRAAQTLVSTLGVIPWRLELSLRVNGQALPVPQALADRLLQKSKVTVPLGVRVDQNSPFVVRLTIDMKMAGADAERLVHAAASGNIAETSFFQTPVPVNALTLGVDAEEQALGTMLHEVWSPSGLPANIAAKRMGAAAGTDAAAMDPAAGLPAEPMAPPPDMAVPPAGLMPGMAPPPGMMAPPGMPGVPPGMPGAAPMPESPIAPPQGMLPTDPAGMLTPPVDPAAVPAAPVDPNAAGAAPAPAPVATPAPVPQGKAFLTISSLDSIGQFIETDLAEYLMSNPNVLMLPSHLNIPVLRDVLSQQATTAGK